jgi:hypothetical protein
MAPYALYIPEGEAGPGMGFARAVVGPGFGMLEYPYLRRRTTTSKQPNACVATAKQLQSHDALGKAVPPHTKPNTFASYYGQRLPILRDDYYFRLKFR